MMYEVTDSGFIVHLDMTVYARQAVMKAFYRLQDRYIISFERKEHCLDVYLDRSNPIEKEAVMDELRSIFSELNFEMLHYDTLKQTSNIRELLVGRALYASCIDMGRDSLEAPEDDDVERGGWEEDRDNIFSSWSNEE